MKGKIFFQILDTLDNMTVIVGWSAIGLCVGACLASVARKIACRRAGATWLLSTMILAPTTSTIFALTAWRAHDVASLVGYSVLASVAPPLAAIDLLDHRLPRVLVLPVYPATFTTWLVAAIHVHSQIALLRSVVGASGAFLFFLLLAFATRNLGAGDVRLAGALGLVLAWHSWTALLDGVVLGLAGAGVAGAILIITGAATPRTSIPLGPALLAGTLLVVLIPLT